MRQSLAADLHAIAAIEQRASPYPLSLSQLLNISLGDNAHCLVIESDGGEVIGYAIYQQVLDEATLMNIAILPACRGRGHGANLLLAVLGQMRQAGLRRCLLEVRRGNQAAIALYRRHGFVEDGLRPNYYPGAAGREDALLMSCLIEEYQ